MRRLFVIVAIASAAVLFSGGRARATCCTTNSDCPGGFTCLGGTCDATIVDCTCDTDCGPNLYCVPAVVTDADCGPGGFACVPNGRFCAGSDCQTTATCMAPPLPASCATDADCPAAWTCEPDTALVTACVPEAPHSCPASGCPATTPTGAKSCLPPLFDLVGLGGFSGPPVVLPASCPVKDHDVTGGAGGATAGAGGAGGGAPATPAGVARPAGGGCQVGGGSATEATTLFWGAVTLLGVSRRRRRRRHAHTSR